MSDDITTQTIDSVVQVTDTNTAQLIADYILYTAKLLCDNKDEIKIEMEGENTIIYKIYAPKEERGKIIGKKGFTIHSIRDLVQKIASPKNIRIQINIIE